MKYSIELYDKIKVTTTYLGYRKQCKIKRFGPDSAAAGGKSLREGDGQSGVG